MTIPRAPGAPGYNPLNELNLPPEYMLRLGLFLTLSVGLFGGRVICGPIPNASHGSQGPDV